MQVRLITRTTGVQGTEYENQSLDNIIIGIARLSSSREVNDLFKEPEKLLRHCILNQHWSIQEMGNLCFEVITSRAMGREFIRHKSLSVQEFSQRYAVATEFEPIEIRMQATNNRQSSTDVFNPDLENYAWNFEYDKVLQDSDKASDCVNKHLELTNSLYSDMLEANVARESARMILPETTQTKMYFNGNIRSWISFLNQRLHKTAQKEIRLIAEAIRDIFIQECPVIAKALFNFEEAYDIHIMERIVLEKYGLFQAIKENGYKKITNYTVQEVEEEVVPNPIWRVVCKKGFEYKGVRTASIRTHEYNKAVKEGYTIELICLEYGTTTLLSPEDVKNKVVKDSPVFGEGDKQYQLFNYAVD